MRCQALPASACVTLIAILPPLSPSAQAAPIVARTVALSGQQAPGTPTGVTFTVFYYASGRVPAINSAGRVVFFARLAGPGVDASNSVGIWSEGSRTLSLVARVGDIAPGAPNSGTFAGFADAPLPISGTGSTAFGAVVAAYACNPFAQPGIWSTSSGTLQNAVFIGDHAPGFPPDVLFSPVCCPGGGGGPAFDSPMLNGGGHVAFSAFWSGVCTQYFCCTSSYGTGIWRGPGPPLVLVDGVPATQIGHPVLNDSDRVAYFINQPDAGYLMGPGGQITRTGWPAPGTPPDVLFAGFNDPDLNNAGRVAFSASLMGPGVDGSNNTGIWSDASGSLDLVMRRGLQAPGTPPGVYFGGTAENPPIGGTGQTAFLAVLGGPDVGDFNNEGIWEIGPVRSVLLAREGSHAPDTPDGTIFSQVGFGGGFRAFGPPMSNGTGQVAFTAGINGQGDFGMWATDPRGVLRLVLRRGDVIEVAAGDLRTIDGWAHLTGSGGQDGRAECFNDLGQIVLFAVFTDGSNGVIVVTVPFIGDMNCDNVNNPADIDAFVLTLLDPAGYHVAHPFCDRLRGDFDRDGETNGGDIQGFIGLLLGS